MATKTTYHYGTYENGSAARKLMPQEEWEEQQQRQKKERSDRKKVRQQQQMTARREARKNTVKILAFAGAFAMILFGYVYLQTSIRTSMNQVADLKEQVADLKANNSALENRIASSANLQVVKQKATDELGMVYANSSQIVYYSMEDKDYMDQYDAIP